MVVVVVAVAPWLCRRLLFQHIREIFAEKRSFFFN
jgi:hypothetical protein